MHGSFVFYKSFAEAMRELPAEEYKEVMIAISDYALDDKEPENLSPVCKAFFILCKPQIDANNARREAGRKGGEAKPKQTRSKLKQTEAKQKQTEPNVNVNDNDINKKPSKEGKKESYSDDPVLDEAMKSYAEYRKKIKAPLTDRAVTLALNKLEELAPGNSAEKAEIINQSIMNGWKGLFALKGRAPTEQHGITRDDDLDNITMLQAVRLHNGIGMHGL